MKINTELTGARVYIRDYRPADLDFAAGMWLDEENGRYLSDPAREYVDEVFQRALDGLQDSGDGYYLVVERKGGRERIGTCCAFPDEAGKVYDIGYCVHKSCWRQGFGREIVELLLDWARDQGATAVTAEAALENRGSCALLEKCGFTLKREASFRKYHMDIEFDSCIYERTLL